VTAETIALLHAARLAEKQQALFYRALAAAAEDADDPALSERLNGLHADEQHQFSRLSVRLMELGESLDEPPAAVPEPLRLEDWEDRARQREAEELERYVALQRQDLDAKTRLMIDQFIAAERSHGEQLGGKWMGAEPW
jgi:rubrerythrin